MPTFHPGKYEADSLWESNNAPGRLGFHDNDDDDVIILMMAMMVMTMTM